MRKKYEIERKKIFITYKRGVNVTMSSDRPINLLGTTSLSRLKFWYESLQKGNPELLTQFDKKVYDKILDLLRIEPARI